MSEFPEYEHSSDPDAPFTQDEYAAAAVVLAALTAETTLSTTTTQREGALEQRLRADARTFFDARRRPRAVTTTSGAEVIITEESGDEDDNSEPRGHSRLWLGVWLAAAACIALGVFFARTRLGASSRDSATATAPTSDTDVINVESNGVVSIRNLAVLDKGRHYVLWRTRRDHSDERIGTFATSSYRTRELTGGNAQSTTQSCTLIVTIERDDDDDTADSSTAAHGALRSIVSKSVAGTVCSHHAP